MWFLPHAGPPGRMSSAVGAGTRTDDRKLPDADVSGVDQLNPIHPLSDPTWSSRQEATERRALLETRQNPDRHDPPSPQIVNLTHRPSREGGQPSRVAAATASPTAAGSWSRRARRRGRGGAFDSGCPGCEGWPERSRRRGGAMPSARRSSPRPGPQPIPPRPAPDRALPLKTTIAELAGAAQARTLTQTARTLTKGDLVALAEGRITRSAQALTLRDIASIRQVFVTGVAVGGIRPTPGCCCCCSDPCCCCCCAASVEHEHLAASA